MDYESRANMKFFVDNYLEDKELTILDIGSMNIKGIPYKILFKNPKWKYVGVDICEGQNVDIVVKDPYNWKEFNNNSIDVVISGQAFEHIEFPWLTIKEIARILKPGGLGCIIAPSTGYEHRHPVDCWRIFPDGMKALAKWAGLEVLKTHLDKEGRWRHTVLIFKK